MKPCALWNSSSACVRRDCRKKQLQIGLLFALPEGIREKKNDATQRMQNQQNQQKKMPKTTRV
jgi:hypothetical protein